MPVTVKTINDGNTRLIIVSYTKVLKRIVPKDDKEAERIVKEQLIAEILKEVTENAEK